MAGGARARAIRRVLGGRAGGKDLRSGFASALLVVTCLVGASLPASAQEPPKEQENATASQDPWATFSYVKPAPVYRLRLGLRRPP